jgi:hypothetical protein
VTDVEDTHGICLSVSIRVYEKEEDAIDGAPAAVEQLPDIYVEGSFSGANGQRVGKVESFWTSVSRPPYQRIANSGERWAIQR